MLVKNAQIVNNYVSKNLVGICKNEEELYKLTNETKKVINYSAIEIRPMTFLFDEINNEIENCYDMELGNTILVGYKLYGQALIDNIGKIIIKVYNQNKEFIAEVPFSIYVDIPSGSVALQEITNINDYE